MKYKTIKQVGEYKHLEQYFTGKWKERFQMFDLYVSGKKNYRQIGEQFGGTTRQWAEYCCKQVYKKITKLQGLEKNFRKDIITKYK